VSGTFLAGPAGGRRLLFTNRRHRCLLVIFFADIVLDNRNRQLARLRQIGLDNAADILCFNGLNIAEEFIGFGGLAEDEGGCAEEFGFALDGQIFGRNPLQNLVAGFFKFFFRDALLKDLVQLCVNACKNLIGLAVVEHSTGCKNTVLFERIGPRRSVDGCLGFCNQSAVEPAAVAIP